MANIIASGDWWRLEDGTLYVYCTGDMPYNGGWTPWLDFRADIQSIVIQNSVTNIGGNAFEGCENLTSVTIGSGVISIGDSAFEGCVSLSGITIPNTVTSIGERAFCSCDGLISITLPERVTSVTDYAFLNCPALVSVTIPVSVTSIGESAFSFCDSLADIYYGGTETQWNAITVGADNDVLEYATIHYSEPEPEPTTDWWRLEDGTLYVYCVGDMPLQYEFPPWNHYNNVIQSVVIQDSVTDIGSCAFDACEHLTSVTIPNSVTSIKDSAFGNCLSLPSVTIPNSVTSIGNSAFFGCPNLTAIVIPGSVTSIDSGAFENSGLVSITMGGGVTSIENEAFHGCNDLSDVYYDGTEAQWNAIEIGDDNEPLMNATIHYNAPTPEPATLESIAITLPPTKTAYTVGDRFRTVGMVVTATYDNGATATVTGYSVSPSRRLTTADTTITVSYTENGVTETAIVEITVTEPQPKSAPTSNRLRIYVKKSDGGTLAFPERSIEQLEYTLSTSLDGRTVQTDQFTAIVRDTPVDWLSRWNGVNQSCPVLLSLGLLTGKYYYKSITRVGKSDFQITAQSPLGRLTDDYPGGLYYATPLPDVIADIIGTVVPAYTVNPLLESVKVYGWLPYQDCRTSLHQLALAYGFIIRRDENNDLYFTVPDTSPYNIPDNAIFTGGRVTYRFGETYARADITAYDYREDETETKTLFDNTNGIPVDNAIIRFDSPVFALQADDTLTVHKAGVNYAKVSGSGRLIGKSYTQIASVISINGDPNADPQHILSVSDIPLITSLNAVAVGERLLSYYNAPAVVNADIVRTNQNPGDCVSFTDPFGDPQTGYIIELVGSVSSFDRASATIVCGYVPTWGAAFDTVDVLTGSDSWIVPASLDGTTIRVVLIGGGEGGSSGQHGTDSKAIGSGRGLPGNGGKVLDVKFTAVAGQSYQYSTGRGGVGGAYTGAYTDSRPDNLLVYVTRTGDRWHLNAHCNGGTYVPTTLKQALAKNLTACENCVKDSAAYYVSNAGQTGTASTFGAYTSDDGQSTTTGFFDVIYGVIYASPGADNGVDGGAATTGTENGNRTNPDYNNIQRFTVALPWDSSQGWTSGTPGLGAYRRAEEGGEIIEESAYGGLGGGAAVGANGDNGANGIASRVTDAYGGGGGQGADAQFIFKDDMTLGSGGSGGHGGGEGGKGGSAYSNAPDNYAAKEGSSGSGGAGSNGQNGADGCILIYYKKPNALQYSFSVRDGQLILTYYTDVPPPFSVNRNGELVYSYADGETPPTFEIRDGILYKKE